MAFIVYDMTVQRARESDQSLYWHQGNVRFCKLFMVWS